MCARVCARACVRAFPPPFLAPQPAKLRRINPALDERAERIALIKMQRRARDECVAHYSLIAAGVMNFVAFRGQQIAHRKQNPTFELVQNAAYDQAAVDVGVLKDVCGVEIALAPFQPQLPLDNTHPSIIADVLNRPFPRVESLIEALNLVAAPPTAADGVG